jgi:phage terminase small subunit
MTNSKPTLTASSELTTKQAMFVKEYLVDLNATRAAIAAGYSKRTAEAAGSRLLRNVKVRAEIDKQTADRKQRLSISADAVLQELARIAFANMMDYMTIQAGDAYVDLSKVTREQAAAIQEITSETYIDGYEGKGEEKKPIVVKRTKFKLGDKRASLELLGKHLKLFTDRTEILDLNAIFDRMSADELEAYARDGSLPPWFEGTLGKIPLSVLGAGNGR